MHSISVACIYTFRTFHGLCLCLWVVQKQQKMYTFVHSMVVLSVSLGGTKTAKIMVQKQPKMYTFVHSMVCLCLWVVQKQQKNYTFCTFHGLCFWVVQKQQNLHILYIPWSVSVSVCVSGWYKNSKIYTFCTFHGLPLSVSLGGTKTANEPVWMMDS